MCGVPLPTGAVGDKVHIYKVTGIRIKLRKLRVFPDTIDIFFCAVYDSRDVNILGRLCQHGRTALFQMRSNPPSLSLHTNTSQCLLTSQEYEPLQNIGTSS